MVIAGSKYVTPEIAQALIENLNAPEDDGRAARETVRPRIPDAEADGVGQAARRTSPTNWR